VTDDGPPPPSDPTALPPPPVVGWPTPDGGGSFGRGAVLTVVAGIVLTLIALVVVLVFRSGAVVSHPPARQLPPPIRNAVVLVPLGAFPADQANAIAAREAADYGLQITVASPLPIPPAAVDVGRGQLTGERLAEAIGAAHPESAGRTVVIGLTTQDIYIAGRPDWRFGFGMRNNSGVALASSARMSRSFDPGGEWNRLGKMVTRYIGFLYYGLEATGDRGDVMYDNILSIDDLIRMSDHL
jgi:predicted Zn-dependent protease